MASYPPAAFAEVALRRYARATNLSVAGREFALDGSRGADHNLDYLEGALQRLGARAVWGVESSPRVHIGTDGVDPVVTIRAGSGGYALKLTDDRPALNAERISIAKANMPLMMSLLPDVVRACQDADVHVLGSTLALEPKTVALLTALADAGLGVHAYGWPDELQLPMLDVLETHGVKIFVADRERTGPRRAFGAALEAAQSAFLASGIDLLIDDGAHLIVRAAENGIALRGASEETTSGIRKLEGAEPVPFPVVAANDAPMKTLFDNAYGTGQSCVFTILDVLAPGGAAWPVVGRRVVVVGFGPVGESVARHVSALGGDVTVVETDPLRCLQAVYHGYGVDELETAVQDADLVISATGVRHTITLAALTAMPADCAVAVAGGVEHEIALDALAASGAVCGDASVPGWASDGRVQRWQRAEDDLGIRVLDHGSCINLSSGEGNPSDIMDYSFAVQLLSLKQLVTAERLTPGLNPFRHEHDLTIARAALACRRGERRQDGA